MAVSVPDEVAEDVGVAPEAVGRAEADRAEVYEPEADEVGEPVAVLEGDELLSDPVAVGVADELPVADEKPEALKTAVIVLVMELVAVLRLADVVGVADPLADSTEVDEATAVGEADRAEVNEPEADEVGEPVAVLEGDGLLSDPVVVGVDDELPVADEVPEALGIAVTVLDTELVAVLRAVVEAKELAV